MPPLFQFLVAAAVIIGVHDLTYGLATLGAALILFLLVPQYGEAE